LVRVFFENAYISSAFGECLVFSLKMLKNVCIFAEYAEKYVMLSPNTLKNVRRFQRTRFKMFGVCAEHAENIF